MSPKHIPRDRTWGTRYDTLGISPPSSPPAQRSATAEPPHTPITSALTQDHPLGPIDAENGSTATTERSIGQESTPHDASIFVGSLPASVEHGELTRRLSDHLSAYSQIKAIKVVRDSRGGVCAFVQCESPSAAGGLLQSLQTDPPRPFLGRFLRFEPAKAFRTLLISYRTPAWSTPLGSSSFATIADGQSTNSRLASAMRIFRPKSGKYLGLLYDADAINFTAATPDGTLESPRHDPFGGDGLLIQPLKYDAETLQKVASAFGTLESFEKHSVETEGTSAEDVAASIPSLYPFPHDAPRSAEMAMGIWEVKWKDREDSVAALLTLRRVPHLTVSWAHHPAPVGASSRGLLRTSILTSPGSWMSPGRGRHFDGRFINGGHAPTHLSPGGPLILHTPSALGTRAFVSPTPSSKSEGIHSSTWTANNSPSPSMRFGRAGTPSARWADQVTEFYEGNATSLSSLSLATSTSGQTTIDKPASVSRANTASSAIHSHCKPSLADLSVTSGLDAGCSQADVNVLLRERDTGIINSPTQPRLHVAPKSDQNIANPTPVIARDWRREIDPSTVFVGGLDMSGRETWDENKLRRIFDRFGPIENVHIVRPLNKRTAFAFVRFASAESGIRAVQEEHNHVYDGYPIRVQLRDRSAASRGVWRPGRGRGRALFGPPHIERDASTFGSVQDFVAGGVQATSSPPIMPQDRSTTSSQGTTSPHSGRDSSLPLDLTDDTMLSRSLQDAAKSSTSSVSSSTTKVPSLRYEISQEPSSTTASSTPPPSNASVSTSVSSLPVAPYPMNMGYFTPQPWAQPYGPPYPYATPVVPGYGYAGYPYPSIHPLASTFFAGEACLSPTVSLSGAAWTSPAADRTYKDMTGCNTRPPGHVNTHQPMMQPPLRATGFIQNEHGTLIPVYQREALDQYMANAHGRQLAPSQSATPPQPGPTFASAGPTTWHQPHALPLCPGGYPVNMPAVGVAPPPSLHPPEQRFWAPGSFPYGVATFPASNHPSVSTLPLPASLAPVSARRAPPLCRPHVAQRGGLPPRRLPRRDHYHAQGTSDNGPQNNMAVVDYSRPVSQSYGHNVHHYRRHQASGC